MTDRPTDTQSIDETLRRAFEAAWSEGRPKQIDQCLPAVDDPRYLPTLEELVHVELEFAWKQCAAGQDAADATLALPSVETYVGRFPQLEEPEILARLIEQECVARRQAGQRITLDEYRKRFPELLTAGSDLESTLQKLAATDETIDAAQAGDTTQVIASRRRTGMFGNYELLDELGRGGMGIVYRARQLSADRIVALKLIRQDRLELMPRDSHVSALERFRHEAQAAAKLQHDNIATVYEVGDVDGEQFYSMRYVEGQALSDLLVDGPLDGRRAAGLIEPTARGVQHAHQAGILHRDLKPHNVLVERQTDRPLVVDFGLAKLLQTHDDLTCAGEVMGSPPYMSPEQASDASKVTVHSDVYGLGATLYHLITGRPPFQAATPLETLRQVIDQQPAPPRQLNASIDADLETICLKCLAKEPHRRYESAAALADDLARYLEGRPIVARPVGTIERAWRWCRRNPVVATLIGSTVTFLVAALVASVVGYVQTSAALLQAERNYERAEQNHLRAERNHLKAERNHQHARSVVHKFFTRVSEDTLLNQPGMQRLQQELLREALDYYQTFLEERADDPTIRDELARTQFRVGFITEQVESPAKALPFYEQAEQMQRQLLDQRPDNPERLKVLGDTLSAMGRALARQNKLDTARKQYQAALDVRQKLAELRPDDVDARRTLANSWMNVGLVDLAMNDASAAQSEYEQAMTIRREILSEHPDHRATLRDLGKGHFGLGRLNIRLGGDEAVRAKYNEAARNEFNQAVDVFERLYEADRSDLGNQYRLVLSCRLLADVLCDLKRWNEAREFDRRALGHLKTLALANPDVSRYQHELAGLYMNLADTMGEQQRAENQDVAESAAPRQEMLELAEDILQQLVDEHPDVADYHVDLAKTRGEQGLLAADGGDNARAAPLLKKALVMLDPIVEQLPDDQELRRKCDEYRDALRAAENDAT